MTTISDSDDNLRALKDDLRALENDHHGFAAAIIAYIVIGIVFIYILYLIIKYNKKREPTKNMFPDQDIESQNYRPIDSDAEGELGIPIGTSSPRHKSTLKPAPTTVGVRRPDPARVRRDVYDLRDNGSADTLPRYPSPPPYAEKSVVNAKSGEGKNI